MNYRLMTHGAIGDAYGAGFEFVDETIVQQENTLQCYRQHQKHLSLLPGMYTDDTQMGIAVAECLLQDCFTEEGLANAFVSAFKRDERAGYAGGFYGFLQSIQDGDEFRAQIKPYSNKNGAAMRSLAIGYLPDTDTVMEYAALQARLTHNTDEGILSAQAAALMAHYCIYALGPRADLGTFMDHLAPLPQGSWSDPWITSVPARGIATVRAAMSALMSSSSLSAVLTASVAFTGDVDTVATLALGAASCHPDSIHDLPSWLFNELEDGAYGRHYLEELDEKLSKRFGVSS